MKKKHPKKGGGRRRKSLKPNEYKQKKRIKIQVVCMTKLKNQSSWRRRVSWLDQKICFIGVKKSDTPRPSNKNLWNLWTRRNYVFLCVEKVERSRSKKKIHSIQFCRRRSLLCESVSKLRISHARWRRLTFELTITQFCWNYKKSKKNPTNRMKLSNLYNSKLSHFQRTCMDVTRLESLA